MKHSIVFCIVIALLSGCSRALEVVPEPSRNQKLIRSSESITIVSSEDNRLSIRLPAAFKSPGLPFPLTINFTNTSDHPVNFDPSTIQASADDGTPLMLDKTLALKKVADWRDSAIRSEKMREKRRMLGQKAQYESVFGGSVYKDEGDYAAQLGTDKELISSQTRNRISDIEAAAQEITGEVSELSPSSKVVKPGESFEYPVLLDLSRAQGTVRDFKLSTPEQTFAFRVD